MEYTEWTIDKHRLDQVSLPSKHTIRSIGQPIAIITTGSEAEANARLIAKAPKMYEAIKQALRTFEAYGIKPTDPRYLMLQQAIAEIE